MKDLDNLQKLYDGRHRFDGTYGAFVGAIEAAFPAIVAHIAHNARVRREACPSCGDSPEHEWVIITPEGKRFTGNTRFEAMNAETSSRIPATVQLANIMKANEECKSEHQAELARVRDLAIESVLNAFDGAEWNTNTGEGIRLIIRTLKSKPVGDV